MERFAQSSALSFPEFLVSTPSAIEEPEARKLAHISRTSSRSSVAAIVS